MKWLKRLLHLPIKPHEKAQIGEALWGRQEAKAEPKAEMKLRVYRAATDMWEDA